MFKKLDEWIGINFNVLVTVGVVLILFIMRYIVIGIPTTEMVDAIAYEDIPVKHTKTLQSPQRGEYKHHYSTGRVIYDGKIYETSGNSYGKKGENVRVIRTTTKRLFLPDTIKIK